MSGALTVSSTASPFPWAAVAAAAYTQKAEIVYDESVSGIELEIDGSKITSEEEAVKALVKVDDSSRVRLYRLQINSSYSYSRVVGIVLHPRRCAGQGERRARDHRLARLARRPPRLPHLPHRPRSHRLRLPRMGRDQRYTIPQRELAMALIFRKQAA